MNILLCCNAGMSTSLLVTKMEVYAKKVGLEGKIWAVSADSVKKEIKEADVVLLGPQVRYLLNDIKKIGEEHGVPVDVISPVDYGMMNGEKVVKHAQQLVK